MSSITKNYLDEETIKNIVERSFGENTLVSYKELDGGFCNAVYRISLTGKRDVILKVAPDVNVKMMSCEKSMMQTEAEAMRLAEANGIEGVPKVYVYDDSKKMCSSAYLIMENKQGNPLFEEKGKMTDEEKQQSDIKTGRLLKQINGIEGEKFGHFCMKELQYDNWFDAFFNMFTGVVNDGINASIDIGVSYAEILEKLSEDKKYFDEVKEPSLIHFDSWDGNFLMKDNEISGIIDWERAMWAEGIMEDRFRYHSLSKAFLEGYGRVGFSVSEKIRSYWYDIYLYFIMMFEGTYRHYETNEQYEWVHGLFVQVWGNLKEIKKLDIF